MDKQPNHTGPQSSRDKLVGTLISRYFQDLEAGHSSEAAQPGSMSASEADFEQENVYHRIRLRISSRRKTRRLIDASLKVAASIAVFVVLLLIYQKQAQWGSFSNPPGLSETATAYGEIRELLLSDGTKLWLNSGSTVTYPSEFKGEIREIQLTGEAFVDVVPDPDKPFVIQTDGVTIRVLGTRFNVSAYRDDNEIKVAVVEGKVSVRADSDQPEAVYVIRNQQAVYSRNSGQLSSQRDIDPESAISWIDGKLIYQSTPFPEIIADIKRKYDVSIQFSEPVADCLISANFSDEPLDKVLSILAELVNGKIIKQNAAYFIEGSGCR